LNPNEAQMKNVPGSGDTSAISGIQRVLQLLLAERISIRDLSTILEGIADALAFSAQPRDHGRTCSRPAGAADLRAEHFPERLSAADRAVGEMGAGVRRIAPGRARDLPRTNRRR